MKNLEVIMFIIFFNLNFMSTLILLTNMSALYVSAELTEARRRRHRIPRDWNYRQLCVTMRVLEIKIESSGREINVLNQ